MTEELAICPACGGSFNPIESRGGKDFCSKSCERRAVIYRAEHGTLEGLPVRWTRRSAKWRELHDPYWARAARMAARDAEYAKLGVAVTVVERDGVVTETRGVVCIAPRM